MTSGRSDLVDIDAEVRGETDLAWRLYDGKRSERKLTAAERAERDAMLELYKDALGMLGDTPLGAHALAKAAE
jgi:uncharacterized protein (UPF0335 family)